MIANDIQQIVLAAIVHDVGKLFERGRILEEKKNDDVCPSDKGYATHRHSSYTWAFCDWLEDRFLCLKELASNDWKYWAAAHHRHDEAQFEAASIRMADRLSASEREEGDYYTKEVHRRTFLEPILERVSLPGTIMALHTQHRYPIVEHGINKEKLFPKTGESLGLKAMPGAAEAIATPVSWQHLLSDKPQDAAYEKLCKGLLAELDELSIRQDGTGRLELDDLISILLMLLERYTANVPSATNIRHPDISLFDHLRTTAAIAQAWYVNERKQGSSRGEAPADEPAWLLVCGDFSGIQKFIYNLTNKRAAKGLRGRSFFVQHFCRIAADYLLRELGLSRVAMLYNSGGKFYLLIPSCQKDRLYKTRAKVNDILIARFSGHVFFGLGVAPVTAAMFSQGAMHSAWKEAALDLERDRLRKFHEQIINRRDFFQPDTSFDPAKSCKVCGSRHGLDHEERCSSCRDLEHLGQWLKDTGAILTIWDSTTQWKNAHFLTKLEKRTVLFKELGAVMFAVPQEQLNGLSTVTSVQGECLFLNEWGGKRLPDLPIPACGIGSMYMGKWDASRQVKAKNGEPWDFEDYANHADGISRIGILRMDVDNLGSIFIQGLRFPERESVKAGGREKNGWGEVRREKGTLICKPMASISRMASLSRQLNHFFSGYVPSLLERQEFNQCQIIYAGGDDLFVIGSWHQLPGLAETIRKEFGEFCCGNTAFTISGGLTLHRGKYPLYKAAQLAGEAEQKAKGLRKSWRLAPNGMEKNSFCFLGVPLLWEDYAFACRVLSLFEKEHKDKKEHKDNKGLLSFLARVVAENKQLVGEICRKKGCDETTAWEEVKWAAWRWRTAYQLRRRYEKKEQDDVREQWANLLFASKLEGSSAQLPFCSWMEMPLRWVDYKHREKGGK